jgi:hypothetical protein
MDDTVTSQAVLSNQQREGVLGALHINPTDAEKARLRGLAERYMEIAESDVMKDRRREWKALNDLKPEKPMILIEPHGITGFLTPNELQCTNRYLRNVEMLLYCNIKQYEVLEDDITFEPYFRLAWQIIKPDYGQDIEIREHHAENSMAYVSNYPIKTPDDLKKLKKRDFLVDRECTVDFKNTLDNIFGDILPVRIGNFDMWCPDMGFQFFTGNISPALSMDVFKLTGYENMMLWIYDEPDALKELIQFISDDRRTYLQWLVDEKLIVPNTDNQFAGPSGYGYVSELPPPLNDPVSTLKDCWCWVESQETNVLGPEMFGEWFLPYLAEFGNQFGLVHYGCCEPLHDRIELIKKAMPKLRAVSVSGWSNFEKMAESLGGSYVYCRKPTPALISGESPNWEAARNDIQRTWDCAKEGPLAFIVRDVYDINNEISRMTEWVRMVKKIIGR